MAAAKRKRTQTRKPRDRDAETRRARAVRYAKTRNGRFALAGAGAAVGGAAAIGAGVRRTSQRRGRRASMGRHPVGGPKSFGMRMGTRAGKQAAGFARTSANSYRASGGPWPAPGAVKRTKRKATIAGAGAVAGAGVYGLAKARVGRSTQRTTVNVGVNRPPPARRRRRRPFQVRRDRQGRFR
jgi:hypothetical protein